MFSSKRKGKETELSGSLAIAAELPRHVTSTSLLQKESMENMLGPFEYFSENPQDLETIAIRRREHENYLRRGLQGLSAGFTSLDASRPWLCYWILHSLDLLRIPITSGEQRRAVSTLAKYQDLEMGGFGGGYMQVSHLAATYAAVNALMVVGTEEAYALVDRAKMYQFLLSMKQEDGSFVMHRGGEVDARGSYCAISVASLLNILTPELTENVAEFLGRCQSYEGGIGACPGCEAHGGYTFCALATLSILKRFDVIDVARLLRWATARQMRWEGGFQGRTNKLVDGCYSFWQGGLFPLLQQQMPREQDGGSLADLLLDREALQYYTLLFCEAEQGGFSDRIENSVDYYHTCYCLSGLSSTQYNVELTQDAPFFAAASLKDATVVGEQADNRLVPVHPIYNLAVYRANAALAHFYDHVQNVQEDQ